MDDKNYFLEAKQLRILREVERRLYDDRPLNGDQRRDLANTLNAILSSVQNNQSIEEN
jgi:hypothetical protein